MPTLSSMKIPPPQSWKEFEEITLDACKIRWENPDLQMHGRQGQPQHGVDVYGANHLFSNIGVQCKNYESELTTKTIRDEIVNAEEFKPKIEMFYIATTLKTDVNIQKEVRIISQKRAREGKFPVMILFWGDIIQDLVRNHSIFKKHYPEIEFSNNHNIETNEIRLYSILDLIYNSLNLDFYCELIFGDGQMSGEDPLQIQSVILTIKYSSSNILNEEEYIVMKKLVEEYKTYLFPKESRKEEFNWTRAQQISNEFIGIAKGIQYNLPAKELIVFGIATILSSWLKWEVNTAVEKWPVSSWNKLKSSIDKLESQDLSSRIIELEEEYNGLHYVYRSNFPDKVYNSIRSELINLNEN